MDLEETLRKRRSVRKYKPEQVDEETIQKLLYYAMCAPSACNKRPWEFYVIKEEALLEQVKHTTRFTNHNAPLAIVVAGNLEKSLPKHLSTYWVQDCSSAITHILLEATHLGLGSLWCGVYPDETSVEKLQATLRLDKTIVPLGIVLIGYPDEQPEERSQYDETCVHILE